PPHEPFDGAHVASAGPRVPSHGPAHFATCVAVAFVAPHASYDCPRAMFSPPMLLSIGAQVGIERRPLPFARPQVSLARPVLSFRRASVSFACTPASGARPSMASAPAHAPQTAQPLAYSLPQCDALSV